MCGLIAVFSPARPPPKQVLVTMRDRLSHRGPDAAGLWCKKYSHGYVAFGHRRLNILDLRAVANQPMISEDGSKVLSFNGEIYNYEAIRRQLPGSSHQFTTRSDTEVLLRAYEAWGLGFLDRLNGMFAITIWDERSREGIIVRDRFGEKPLFYTRAKDGALVFASEIKALLPYPGVICAANHRTANAIVENGSMIYGSEETLFHGIKQFPSSHYMRVSATGDILQLDSYWRPDYRVACDGGGSLERIKTFKGLLRNAVVDRLRCDVRGTACLSGGLDSSALAWTIANTNSPGFELDSTISVRFPRDREIDEGKFQDCMHRELGVAAASITPSDRDLMSDIRRLHWHHESVVAGPSMYLEWSVMKWARENGYTVIIDGQGADELLAGYEFYFPAFMYDNYARCKGATLWTNRIKRRRRAGRPPSQYSAPLRWLFNAYSIQDKTQFDEFWRTEIDTLVVNHPWIGSEDVPKDSALRYMLGAHLMRISLPSNLYSGDRNSMAHSIETRYPFLDYDLVDFCLQLPDEMYIRNGWTKWILRQCMDSSFPRAVRWRVDKIGFSAPSARWMRGALRNWVEDRIFDPRLRDYQAYEPKKTELLWKEHSLGNADNSQSLWVLASLMEWREMLDMGTWGSGVHQYA